MRALLSLLIAVAIVFVAYRLYLTRTVAPGPEGSSMTVPTQAITLTGVKNDLNAIAQAERAWFAEHGSYATLDELTSSGALTMKRPGRDGYSYSVNVSANGFTVTARYQGPSGLNYPVLVVDQTMQIRESR